MCDVRCPSMHVSASRAGCGHIERPYRYGCHREKASTASHVLHCHTVTHLPLSHQEPLAANPRNSVIGFHDNSSALRGGPVTPMLPLVCGSPSALVPQPRDWDLLLTAETHNFPCAVAPYPGAAPLHRCIVSCCGTINQLVITQNILLSLFRPPSSSQVPVLFRHTSDMHEASFATPGSNVSNCILSIPQVRRQGRAGASGTRTQQASAP